MQDYLSNRWQRTRVGTKYSSWVKLSKGVPQGSILGPILFNVYLNDLFYIFINSEVCNLADDTTPFVCEMDLDILLQKLESEGYSVIEWFKNNYMQLNQGKCHFLLTGCEEDNTVVTFGNSFLNASDKEKLLGILIDKKLKFDAHIKNLCTEAGKRLVP